MIYYKKKNIYNLLKFIKRDINILDIGSRGGQYGWLKDISKKANFINFDADPNIIYTLTSDRDGEKKSESFKVPFSVVRRSNPNNHFAAVLAHLKGEMEEREQIAVTPPDPEEEGR